MDTKPRKRSKINWSKIVIIGLLGLALLAFILQAIPTSNRTKVTEPPFQDMGNLSIYDGSSESKLATIDIEVAQTPEAIRQGLMFRRSMEDDQGMLFLMDSLEPQSFWMANTYISLDIIYLDDQKRIVSIAENTTPQSREPIPSGAPAQYVLEVNAGFARAKGLKVGDLMEW